MNSCDIPCIRRYPTLTVHIATIGVHLWNGRHDKNNVTFLADKACSRVPEIFSVRKTIIADVTSICPDIPPKKTKNQILKIEKIVLKLSIVK